MQERPELLPMPAEWCYDDGDPSVGLQPGGWMHEACPVDWPDDVELDTVVEQISETFYGSGYNRGVVRRFRLTCTNCGQVVEVDDTDWAPDGDDDQDDV
jgi:hypothetical protein